MKKRKVLAMILTGAMCLGLLAGCGEGKADHPGSGEAGANTIQLGCTGPLTGKSAIYGTAVENGAKVAVEEINAMGGLQFDFRCEDDVGDAETAVNAYNALLDWGMDILVGPVTSGSAIAVSTEAYAERIFMLTPSGSAADITQGKDNVFQVCFSDPNQGFGSAVYMGKHMADAKIAIIYRNDDPYSQGVRDTFVEEAKKEGLEIVYEGTFTESTDTDFSVQLTGAQSAGADLVFLPIYYQPASVILNQANQMGYEPKFFGVDGMDGILTMKGFDTALAEGLMLLTPFSADAKDEKTQNFVKKYQEAYGEAPNQFAADAYDAIYILYQAIEAAGITADMSYSGMCEKLVEVMPTITYDGLTGQGLTWNDKGEVSKEPLAVVIKDGVYVMP